MVKILKRNRKHSVLTPPSEAESGASFGNPCRFNVKNSTFCFSIPPAKMTDTMTDLILSQRGTLGISSNCCATDPAGSCGWRHRTPDTSIDRSSLLCLLTLL